MTTINSALRASLKVLNKLKPLCTTRNAIIALVLLNGFGVIKPETATKLRNTVLLIEGTGDISVVGE